MNERRKQLTSIANASGFLFQRRVAHLVSSSRAHHGWTIAASEHPWADDTASAAGFLDLVLSNDQRSLRLGIECKRVTEGAWLFLQDSDQESTGVVRGLLTINSVSNGKTADWRDVVIDPVSPQAAFCIVRGSGEAERPLLERLAFQIASATESFAAQELKVEAPGSLEIRTLYIPVIVTNAELVTCSLSPDKIDVATGKVHPEDANYEVVSAVRFRKPLTTNLQLEQYQDVAAINRDSERTVFVVNATALPDWLRQLQFVGELPSIRHPRLRP